MAPGPGGILSRILWLPRYDAAGPSSRYRSYQFLPGLRERGHDIHVEPLLGDGYVEALYQGRSVQPGRVAVAYIRRVARILRADRFDLVWVEKECFPWLPAWLEALLAKAGVPYVVDYDDATFHRYDQHRSRLVRWALGSKIDRVMRGARLVVAGNSYLAGRARAAGAPWVEMLPTVVDLDRYPSPAARQVALPSGPTPLRIGWIGSPATERYVRTIAPALRLFCEGGRGRVSLIGARPGFEMEGVPVETLPWSSDSEVSEMAKFDVGIMPLTDDPWARGKCGFKLIQYMGCGLPVIASPVGVNTDLVDSGVNGFLASSQDDWLWALESLASDPQLRTRMGLAGRVKMERDFTVQGVLPRLDELIRKAVGPRVGSQGVRR